MSDAHFQVQNKLLELEEALLAKSPTMPTLLRDIHRKLKADPDIVTLLTEDECNIVAEGLKHQTGVELATKVRAKATKKSMKTMDIGVDL